MYNESFVYCGWIDPHNIPCTAVFHHGERIAYKLRHVHPFAGIGWGDAKAQENLAFSILTDYLERRPDDGRPELARIACRDFARQFFADKARQNAWILQDAKIRLWLGFWQMLHTPVQQKVDR